MTLPRTKKRRASRQRAKARAKARIGRKPTTFMAADWVMRDSLKALADINRTHSLFNREYK